MQILTRSRRIRKALNSVRAGIPSHEWRAITDFLTWIQVDREWQTFGLSAEVRPVAAELVPLFESREKIKGAQIRFVLPLCRLYSNTAIVGVVAHELAHAARAVRFGKDWFTRMGGVWNAPGANRRYWTEEKHADSIASGWGFSKQIRAMRKERKEVLNPYLAVNNERILRQVERRDRIAEEKARRNSGLGPR
jgi:hypothetical protein